MFRGKHGPVVVLALLCVTILSLTFASPKAVADRGEDESADRNKELRLAQKAVLDPQTETGERRDYGATRGPSGAGRAETQAGSTSSALPASSGGRWAYAAPLRSGFNAIHVVVGRGKILLVAGSGNSAARFAAGTFESFLCSATLTQCKQVETPVDLFCAGHVLLPDGRALVGGGTISYSPFKGAKYLYAFNFTTERYERLTPMEVGRWYPTMVTTINGTTLITGGFNERGAVTGTTEIFDHRTNTHRLLPGEQKFPLYPRISLTKRGDYFYSGAGFGGTTGTTPPGFWDPFRDRYTPVKGLRTPKQRSSAASCFIGDIRNQRLLVMGGGSPAVNTTDRIKLSTTTPTFVPGPTLKAKKQYLSCLTLPDGSLLEAGGGLTNKIESASYEASLLPSFDSSWKSLNPIPAGNHRLYHSSHFLLDDGRVVSLGSEPKAQPRSESVLVYSPPYLYKGERPTIVAAPTVIKRGSQISVRTTGGANRVTFTRPPSPTHGMDVGDGYMSFPITNGKVNMAGALARYMPTGYYRMWAVNARGAVSRAKWVYMCDPSTEGTACHCC
jgi:hypothetical protein